MNVTQSLLTVNPYSRPGWKLHSVMGLIYHWTAMPLQPAIAVRQFFEFRAGGKNGYGSAHYVIDVDGSVLALIPENEVAFHVGEQGEKNIDPASGKVYTDWAREKFGDYGDVSKSYGPNFVTVGVEMVPIDDDGRFSTATLGAARELGVDFIRRHSISVEQVGTHHGVVGWKDCPRWWTNHPDEFERFKGLLQRELLGGIV